ncbi:DUF938 domain-containing protein [Ruegeria sp. Ofav3-42]|uniref:DUF938 domain-containing protein n=1 Tax=Ruegeria sp. Ofav3-42 TaxID=2917759 RepID=UPI001EF52CD6|nr:DUF938 domain-containing protein [Ruegeria sp. Ofav3-42]MCG7519473.1 class I SAM-dependent methyltransferase [Ruegeria sp. Ofav3-42]
MTPRKLPPNASVATASDGEKMVAPAASRNAEALCDLLARFAPPTGRALELASGTGQHVAAFAQRLRGLNWQPSEVEPQRRISIDAYADGFENIAPAIELNATDPGWHSRHGAQDLIVLVNLLHLISWPEVKTLVTEAALSLNPGGRLVLYGPFMRAGQLTSEGDQNFHAALTQQYPEIGYKDDGEIRGLLRQCNLTLVEIVEMPANNLAFVSEKPRT